MNIFDKIKKYYTLGIYKRSHVAVFVKTGHLTAEQYMEITGDEYIVKE